MKYSPKVRARQQYEMSQEQLDTILKAGKPVMYLIANGTGPTSPQASANAAWVSLGREMGFDGMTVEPVPGAGDRVFTATSKALAGGEGA
jgi:hypothetical protein